MLVERFLLAARLRPRHCLSTRDADRFGYVAEVSSLRRTPDHDTGADGILITSSMVRNLQGEEFDEDGAPHQKMVARLSLSE